MKAMSEKRTSLLFLFFCTVFHFVVDLSCIYFMTASLIPMARSHSQWLAWAVFYNTMAFAFPALAGYLADRFLKRRHLWLAALGCLLVAAGYVCFRIPLLCVFLLGLGNGLFHIGAGVRVMKSPLGRFAPSGIFISSGALGVYLGSLWGRSYRPLWNLFGTLLLLAAASLFWLDWADLLSSKVRASSLSSRPRRKDRQEGSLRSAMIPCLFLVVFVRSYYGSIQNYSWKRGLGIQVAFTLCVAFGKLLGGVLADRIGLKRTVKLSLLFAAATALVSFWSPLCGCVSILFFNMTMPLTLTLLGETMPQRPGLAFGLLMLALFFGTLPTMLFQIRFLFSPPGLCILCLASLAALLWAMGMMCESDPAPANVKPDSLP